MLYIVGTPIGNLEDLSYRQAKVLTDSEIILAEDTRKAQNLLHAVKNLFGFRPPLNHKIISYYKEKELDKLPQILDWLKEGKKVSLISDAGMPLISDPGYLLIKAVNNYHIPHTVIPGPSAVTTALLHAGYKTDAFMFLGFAPKKKSHIVKLLQKVQQVKDIMPETVFVAFESPNRIHDTLKVLDEVMPENNVIVTRELTKKFEEIYKGTPKRLQQHSFKGEITIVF